MPNIYFGIMAKKIKYCVMVSSDHNTTFHMVWGGLDVFILFIYLSRVFKLRSIKKNARVFKNLCPAVYTITVVMMMGYLQCCTNRVPMSEQNL